MVSTLKLALHDTEKYHETSPDEFFNHLGGLRPAAYCRWLWYRNDDPEGRHLYVPCGQTRRHRTSVSSLQEFRDRVPGQINQYYTPNVFFDWRKKALLAGFCANYVEIDTTLDRGLRPDECEQVRNEVFAQLVKSAIPLPSAIVESGSGGLHLYWTYEMLDAYPARQALWTKVSHALTSAFTGGELWKVDYAASHDITRFLRVPGSVHAETVCDVRAFRLNKHDLPFDELAAQLDVAPVDQRVSFGSAINEPAIQDSERTASSGYHSISAWWLRIYWHLHNYLRKVGRLKQGNRDSVAFIMFVALRRTVSLNKAWSRIKEINANHIGLGERELESYLSTASRTHYRYKKETLVEYMKAANIPVPDFLMGETINWKVSKGLDPEEIRLRQSKAAISSASKRREGTLGSIMTAIRNGANKVKEIALSAGVSVRTVQRYINDNKASLAGLVYPPPRRDVLS
ncbi:hypothetical protein [Pantoea agglomerans]|uniref:hypothetical protein n=1 Tax=Pantoea TaxID=53335 RepID=UPI003208BDB9